MINAIVQEGWYSVQQCEENPDTLFVFGDNMVGEGHGGQAQIRDCENSIGIPTKRAPAMDAESFFQGRVEEVKVIHNAVVEVRKKYESGGYIRLVFPGDGLGTGLAQLHDKCPELYNYMNEVLYLVFGVKYGLLARK